jgi:hypothetical protein
MLFWRWWLKIQGISKHCSRTSRHHAVSGEADPFFPEAKRASGLIPGAQFFSLPGLNHLEAFVRSDRMSQHFCDKRSGFNQFTFCCSAGLLLS